MKDATRVVERVETTVECWVHNSVDPMVDSLVVTTVARLAQKKADWLVASKVASRAQHWVDLMADSMACWRVVSMAVELVVWWGSC